MHRCRAPTVIYKAVADRPAHNLRHVLTMNVIVYSAIKLAYMSY